MVLYISALPVICRNECINMLVYFEMFEDMPTAITREKSLKGISRAKKIALIESVNPLWEDLTSKLELLKP